MQEIEQYAFFWRAEDNAGSLHLCLANGTGADVALDSAMEGYFLLDMLRNEKPCYFDSQNGLICSGLELAGKGAAASAPKKKRKKAA